MYSCSGFYNKALLTFYCTVCSAVANVDVCYCSSYWSANWAALGGSLALISGDGWLPSVWLNTLGEEQKTRTLITNTIFLMGLLCLLDCYTNYLPPLALRISDLGPHVGTVSTDSGCMCFLVFSRSPCSRRGWTTPWLCLRSRSPVCWPTPSSAHFPDATPASQSTAITLRSTSTGKGRAAETVQISQETGCWVAHWIN